MKEFNWLTIYSQTALSGIIAILCFFSLGKREKKTNLIGLLFLIGFLCNVVAYFLMPFGKIMNLPSSVYDFVLITLVGMLYNFATRYRYRGFFNWATALYIAFAITNLIFFQKTDNSSYNKLLGSFLILSYAVFYFYRLMVDLPTMQIQRLPMFWFNSGFLIYHAGTIFLFAFTSYLTNVLNNNLLVYWSFHNSLSILEHIIVLIGLYYQRILNVIKT